MTSLTCRVHRPGRRTLVVFPLPRPGRCAGRCGAIRGAGRIVGFTLSERTLRPFRLASRRRTRDMAPGRLCFTDQAAASVRQRRTDIAAGLQATPPGRVALRCDTATEMRPAWSSSFTGMRCAGFTSRCRKGAPARTFSRADHRAKASPQARPRDDARPTTEDETTPNVKYFLRYRSRSPHFVQR